MLSGAYPLGDLFEHFVTPDDSRPGAALGYRGPRFPRPQDHALKPKILSVPIAVFYDYGHSD